jgi:Kef-type K+ transport system membrane component KefB
LILATAAGVEAAGGEGTSALDVGIDFLWILIILVGAKLSNLIARYGLPPVLGELLVGVIMGNLALLGFHFFEPIKQDIVIRFLAELGVVILLFQIGLESNVQQMLQVGPRALLVACVGVVAPFVLITTVVGPLLLSELSFNEHLFLGAILAATSVGITARVLLDLGKLQTPEARIILGAAVIDDVLGLAILAVVKAIVEVGDASFMAVGWITCKACLFLGGAIYLGHLLVLRLGRLFSKINPGLGMEFTVAVGFCLFFAYLGERIGLAPIVGAFAAGLVLEPVCFKHFQDPSIVNELSERFQEAKPEVKETVSHVVDHLSQSQIQDLIRPLGYFLVPIFFVLTGMQVRLETLLNPSVLLLALAVAVVAFLGKLVAGLVAGRVNKSIVGWGMVTRCEVGLIFAATGKALGVISDEVFSMAVIVIMLTTLVPLPILSYLLRRHSSPVS